MKTINRGLLLFACLFIVIFLLNACAKKDHSTDLPKEQQIVGVWGINRVQLKLYSGSTFLKDTILPKTPKPKNFINFDANTGFEYKFNTTTSDIGTYQFSGSDSLIAVTPGSTYRWKMLTMTNVLFTLVNTSTNDPAFPGLKVETYYTLAR
ncbi:MAG TPA: hypothetical protein PK987_02320 [Ferruginibacter sp.]|nr:hypothetical protein [Ferruginibacter sp.]